MSMVEVESARSFDDELANDYVLASRGRWIKAWCRLTLN